MRALILRGLAVILLWTVAACGARPTPGPAGTAQPYPVGDGTSLAYPAATAQATPRGDEVTIAIDKPLRAGTAQVTGSGPAGVPLVLNDVTFMGEVLGETTVGSDGRFVISVAPLAAGHRLGISIGELAGTRWTMEDFFAPGYQGDGAMQIPNVGYFFDTALVEE